MTRGCEGDVPRIFSRGDAMGTLTGTSAGTSGVRDGAMTTHPDLSKSSDRPGASTAPKGFANPSSPPGALHDALAWWSIGRRADTVMDHWTRAGVPTAGSSTPVELAMVCRGDPARLADVLERLAALVPADEVATVFMLFVLEPAVSARLRRLRVAESDVTRGVVVSSLWEAITTSERRDAATLVRAASNAARREVRRSRALARFDRTAEVAAVSGEPTVTDGLDALLGEATRVGAIRVDQAALLHAVYLEDRDVRDVARAMDKSPAAVTKARRRSEQALAAYVRRSARR